MFAHIEADACRGPREALDDEALIVRAPARDRRGADSPHEDPLPAHGSAHHQHLRAVVKCYKELLGWDMPRTMFRFCSAGSSTTTTAPVAPWPRSPAQLDPAEIVDAGLQAVRSSASGPAVRRLAFALGSSHHQHRSRLVADRRPPRIWFWASCVRPAPGSRTRSTSAARSPSSRRWRQRAWDPYLANRERFERALTYAEVVYPLREDNVPYTEGPPVWAGAPRPRRDRATAVRKEVRSARQPVTSSTWWSTSLRDALGGAAARCSRGGAPRERRRRAERALGAGASRAVDPRPGARAAAGPARTARTPGGGASLTAAMWSMQHGS